MTALVEFYPRHIDKEDKHFFLPVMEYFSREEKDALLARMDEFDRGLHPGEIPENSGRLGGKRLQVPFIVFGCRFPVNTISISKLSQVTNKI